MIEIINFGKYSGHSVEQIAFKDYKYFAEFLVDDLLKDKKIKRFPLEKRIELVEYKLNNFKSVQPCGNSNCKNLSKLISIYSGYGGEKNSSTNFVYCSYECFDKDAKVTIQREKANLVPLKFRSALFENRGDTGEIINVMIQCTGIKNLKLTKEELEKFFDKMQTI